MQRGPCWCLCRATSNCTIAIAWRRPGSCRALTRASSPAPKRTGTRKAGRGAGANSARAQLAIFPAQVIFAQEHEDERAGLWKAMGTTLRRALIENNPLNPARTSVLPSIHGYWHWNSRPIAGWQSCYAIRRTALLSFTPHTTPKSGRSLQNQPDLPITSFHLGLPLPGDCPAAYACL